MPSAPSLARRARRQRQQRGMRDETVPSPVSPRANSSRKEEDEEDEITILPSSAGGAATPVSRTLLCGCSSDDERHTHPWKTFDFDQIRNSKRFNYLADPLLIRGYSIQKRRRDVLLSLFAWHNETINVWSHLIGGILFVFLFASWWCYTHEIAPPQPPVWLTAQHGEELFREYATSLSNEIAHLKSSANEFISARKSDMAEDGFPHALFFASLKRSKETLQKWMVEEKDLLAGKLDESAAWMQRRVSIAEWVKSSLTNSTSPLATLLRENLLLAPEAKPITFDTLAHLYFHQNELATTMSMGNSLVPLWPMLVFCFGGTMCLLCSAIYHLFVGYHCNTYNMLCRVDLAGISFMIWGSCVPPIYYVFYGDAFVRNAYLLGCTIMCSLTLLFTMLPAQHMHGAKVPRVVAYLAAGAFSVAPLLHAIMRWGIFSDEVVRYTNEGMYLIVALLYVFGAAIYISRFPEKFFPGYFDFVFASHQIWHLSVFAAAIVHYYGLVKLYLWRVEMEQATCKVY